MAFTPSEGCCVREERLSYQALPWDTHPIDTVHGPQGWGPMNGPYTPFNFPELVTNMANGGIDITWSAGSNLTMLAPPYGVTTIFTDNSTALVNAQLAAINDEAAKSRGYSSTISNADFSQSGSGSGMSGKAAGLTGALKSALSSLSSKSTPAPTTQSLAFTASPQFSTGGHNA